MGRVSGQRRKRKRQRWARGTAESGRETPGLTPSEEPGNSPGRGLRALLAIQTSCDFRTSFFSVFIELITTFAVLRFVFLAQGMWDLRSQTRIKPVPLASPHWKAKSNLDLQFPGLIPNRPAAMTLFTPMKLKSDTWTSRFLS